MAGAFFVAAAAKTAHPAQEGGADREQEWEEISCQSTRDCWEYFPLWFFVYCLMELVESDDVDYIYEVFSPAIQENADGLYERTQEFVRFIEENVRLY